MTKRLLICLAVLSVLCAFSALAQENPHDQLLKAHATATAVVPVPDVAPAGAKLIYNSFGPSPTDKYNATDGYYILGNANATINPGTSQAIAINFHATANEHLTELHLPIAYANLGDGAANTFDVTIYNDVGGLPGAVISPAVKSKTNGNVGACCQDVTVKFKAPGVALTAAISYWVVVDTVAGSTTEAVWNFTYLTAAGNVGGAGWGVAGSYLPAAQVYATIP